MEQKKKRILLLSESIEDTAKEALESIKPLAERIVAKSRRGWGGIKKSASEKLTRIMSKQPMPTEGRKPKARPKDKK